MSSRLASLVFWGVTLVCGCGSDATTGPSGSDAGTDATADGAATDGGTDAASDAATESGSDGGVLGHGDPCDPSASKCGPGLSCCYPARPGPGVVPICRSPGEVCNPP